MFGNIELNGYTRTSNDKIYLNDFIYFKIKLNEDIDKDRIELFNKLFSSDFKYPQESSESQCWYFKLERLTEKYAYENNVVKAMLSLAVKNNKNTKGSMKNWFDAIDTNVTAIPMRIKQGSENFITFAIKLNNCDNNECDFSSIGVQYIIPMLEDVFKHLNSRVGTYIENKRWDERNAGSNERGISESDLLSAINKK